MQQVTGRLTADATVKTLESGKTVVNFSIAENQRYKPKGSDDYVDIPTFFNVSYWLSTSIAQVLRKGTTVLLNGRIRANPYYTNTNALAASLEFKASRIEIQSFAPKKEEGPEAGAPKTAAASGSKKNAARKQAGQQAQADDLPF